MKKRDRDDAGIKLPGGAMITFKGYLPDKTCRDCQKKLPAAMFLRMGKRKRVQKLSFNNTCCWCARAEFPRDLLPMELTSSFTDDSDKLMGWRERERVNGEMVYGDELRLNLMQFRIDSRGVIRPQPKLDRRSAEKKAARPRKKRAPILFTGRDSRRSFYKKHTALAAQLQGNKCLACGDVFTADDPPVGGHRYPHSRGGSSRHLENIVALHARCNAQQGDMTLDEYMRQMAKFQPLPF